MPSDAYVEALRAGNYILSQLPQNFPRLEVAIICGSGLSGLVSTFHTDPQISIPYHDIPNFPVGTVEGHANSLVFGTLGEKRSGVVAMSGRFHFYEGYDMAQVTFPIRVFHVLKIQCLIVTNASGGLNRSFEVGDLVVVKDHINLPGLAGNHPLRGPNPSEFGPRFPPLSDAYSLTLRKTLFQAAQQHRIYERRRVYEGTYVMVSGPSYETRAEASMIRAMGADIVGMSTVPEVIVARHCGIQVLCISLVTNMVVVDPTPGALDENASAKSMAAGMANHEEVLRAGKEAALDMQGLIAKFVDLL